ncbi:dihydrofolate reductase family protein [Spirillospora sp. CA-294931]|uniref:dihydrofolate reductase family protein n=1 Tax=Spirillospora sp. CA-294931 TaxID=3240042 RepID=UPI003D8D12BD
MRKIINSTYMTLDGVIENPQNWPSTPGDDGTGGTVQTELLASCDAVLMGRKTYEGFAPVWQARSGDPLSDRMNSIDKYVASSTLRDPEWNNTTVIDGDLIAEIKRLKEQPGKDIVQYGFGEIAHALVEHGLLDELRLWVYPFLLRNGGTGDLLFGEGSTATFDLVDTQPLKSGIVILTYRASTSS